MPPAETARLGKFFRDRREQAGLTQTQLARAVGVSQNTVSKWETGHARVAGVHLGPLLAALHIDPADYAAQLHTDAATVAAEHLAAATEHIATAIEQAARTIAGATRRPEPN